MWLVIFSVSGRLLSHSVNGASYIMLCEWADGEIFLMLAHVNIVFMWADGKIFSMRRVVRF